MDIAAVARHTAAALGVRVTAAVALEGGSTGTVARCDLIDGSRVVAKLHGGSGAPPAAEAARAIEAKVAEFARSDPFLSGNVPPTVTFNGFHAEGYVLEPGSQAEAVLAGAHRAATGRELQSFMTPGYLDTRVHALYDKVPALCYGPISENIHGVDERVSLSSLKRVTTAMALFVAEWCGTEAWED